MPTITPEIQQFWNRFLASLPPETEKPTLSDSWYFCNTPELANELGQLARQGTKTATAGLLWSHEAENEPLPQPGQFFIITDWDNHPLCVIETTVVQVVPFNQVEEEQAFLEGEGNRSLEFWREVHWRFFSMECREIGKQPSETMPVVCERFRPVYPA